MGNASADQIATRGVVENEVGREIKGIAPVQETLGGGEITWQEGSCRARLRVNDLRRKGTSVGPCKGENRGKGPGLPGASGMGTPRS